MFIKALPCEIREPISHQKELKSFLKEGREHTVNNLIILHLTKFKVFVQ